MSELKDKNLNSGAIGVFDSGLGGLSVLRALLKKLPNYSYFYLGDTARVPYGERSSETIFKYTVAAVEFLFKHGCSLVIVACNTASSQALRRLQQEWLPKNYPDYRVLGVIRPLVEAIALSNKKHLGIIGTTATIKSQTYTQELKFLKPGLKIAAKATPLLVPLVEEGRLDTPETRLILEDYLKPLKMAGIDSLALACTHYPYLQNLIKELLGPEVLIYDSGKIIADSLNLYLKNHPELNLKTKNPERRFYVSDNPASFASQGEKFLGQSLKNLELANL
ncbi:glutamate racemase [Candidatus Falkowbacteria bacterium]|nr:glutamate racemase [Candidatus Falkowbacteria bacterium]